MTKNSVAYTFKLNLAVRVWGFPVDPGLGYGIPYISIAAVYESLARATTVRND